MELLVNYHGDDSLTLTKLDVGDWIDLRSAETVDLTTGQYALISLGISVALPEGYEAHIVPRSSTYRHWGLLQVNSMGVIDNSYSGDDDIWKMPVYATWSTHIEKGDRIAQFRIVPKQPEFDIISVEHLEGPSRGGFGSTGKS